MSWGQGLTTAHGGWEGQGEGRQMGKLRQGLYLPVCALLSQGFSAPPTPLASASAAKPGQKGGQPDSERDKGGCMEWGMNGGGVPAGGGAAGGGGQLYQARWVACTSRPAPAPPGPAPSRFPPCWPDTFPMTQRSTGAKPGLPPQHPHIPGTTPPPGTCGSVLHVCPQLHLCKSTNSATCKEMQPPTPPSHMGVEGRVRGGCSNPQGTRSRGGNCCPSLMGSVSTR